MAKRKVRRNYNFLSKYSYYTPGIKGMVALLCLLLAGVLLGNFVMWICLGIVGGENFVADYGMLISYPLMFVPPMIYASLKSSSNALFDTGYSLDRGSFAPVGVLMCCLMAVLGTLAASIISDGAVNLLPPMPDWLEEALNSMVNGELWVNFLCACVMAPIFEEWLCRGMVLRGLLNYTRRDKVQGLKPSVAIIISAAFFALIHANPWQAIPAFALGCLFGYVYYRTGSLKLTMLMHFTNNAFALLCSNLDVFDGIDSWVELLGTGKYIVLCAACLLMVIVAVREFHRVALLRPQGNCGVLDEAE
jgi:uncharacterized protein